MVNRAAKGNFPDDYLLYLMARASHLISADFHAKLKDENIDYKTWRILAAISDKERTVGELARIALLNQPTLSKALSRLERDNFIVRKVDKNSRRRVNVYPTSKGKKVAATLKTKARAHEKKILSHFDRDEQLFLKSALVDFITRYEE